MNATYRWIHKVWYGGAKSGLILLPLSGLYWIIIKARELLYRCGVFKTYKAHVPVVVVGNITAGGTGKTPTVIWLVNQLRTRGFSPGIISRGYGGSKSGTSMRVDADSDVSVVGDEPVLLARRGLCPVAVDSDRVRAATMLSDDGVDVIVADDGLQHRRLQRDFEVCVIDGKRMLGNSRLLPAGPLRESARRLLSVDATLVNGGDYIDASRFDLVATEAQRINGSLTRALSGFKDTTVHAVAGIGNPQRFFDLLRENGIQVIEHEYRDHAAISVSELQYGDEFEVFMTEKDAVKLNKKLPDKFWTVPVDLTMDDAAAAELLDELETRLRNRGGRQ